MPVNRDFKDLLSEFNAAEVRYLVVGAHAVIFYSVPRYTKDLDIWIEPTRENAERAYRALAAFGAPLANISMADLCTPETILQIGVEPNRIDILTDVEGLRFEDAWRHRQQTTYGGEPVGLLSLSDLIAAKKAAGRPQDLLDLEWLEKAEEDG